jgi:hypothetical protein
MAERKVQNKYYPPDFDPAAIEKADRKRKRRDRDKRDTSLSSNNKSLAESRIMLPVSISCDRCHSYIYKGKKFNARKIDVPEDRYLGIKVYRFIFRCTSCSNEIWMKTDPKNADYVIEKGAMRNYEPMRDAEKKFNDEASTRENEEKNDIMLALENKTLNAKREMEINEELEDIREINAKQAQVDTQRLLNNIQQQVAADNEQKDIEEQYEDELLASAVFGKTNDGKFIKRIVNSNHNNSSTAINRVDPASHTHSLATSMLNGDNNISTPMTTAPTSLSKPSVTAKRVVVVKKKTGDTNDNNTNSNATASTPAPVTSTKTITSTPAASSSISSLLGNYASDEDDDEDD